MRHIDWKDVGKRAGKTFIQAFLASMSIEQLAAITDAESAKVIIHSMLIAGASAGISAVWNMVTSCISQEESEA